ncbi:MAG: DUF1080 domain-containing protein [Planctomycetes bacterium]|nr:DUF1080 domain-containing protein [Planctomycetota bacterium]
MGAVLPRRLYQHKVYKISAAAIMLVLGVLLAAMADDESAMVYLKKASAQVKKKEYTASLENFNKAIDESPEMPEIYFERGSMYWQIKEMSEAMADFDKVLWLLNLKASLSKPQEEMRNKISAYQDEYNRMKDELSAIHKKYADKLLEFTDKNKNSADSYLFDLLKRLQAINPANDMLKAEIQKIREAMSFQEKNIMTPLFNGTDLTGWEGSKAVWSVKNGIITGDLPDAANMLSNSTRLKGGFSLSVAQKLETKPADETEYVCGLSFGIRDLYNYYSCTFFKNRLTLIQCIGAKGTVKNNFLVDKALPDGVIQEEWNCLMIKVDGDKISGYLNDELQFEIAVPAEAKSQFDGITGLMIQSCRASFKDILYLSE